MYLEISNEVLEYIRKIIKYPKNDGVLIKGVTKKIKNKQRRKVRFIRILLGTLDSSLSRNVIPHTSTSMELN